MNLVKVLALSLVLAVVGGTLTGCGNSGSDGNGAVSDRQKQLSEEGRRSAEAQRLR